MIGLGLVVVFFILLGLNVSKYRSTKLEVARREMQLETYFEAKDVQVFKKIYKKRVNICKLEVVIVILVVLVLSGIEIGYYFIE